MIEKEEVFEAVRRGYSELNTAPDSEILDYFSTSSTEEMHGHISNVKGYNNSKIVAICKQKAKNEHKF